MPFWTNLYTNLSNYKNDLFCALQHTVCFFWLSLPPGHICVHLFNHVKKHTYTQRVCNLSVQLDMSLQTRSCSCCWQPFQMYRVIFLLCASEANTNQFEKANKSAKIVHRLAGSLLFRALSVHSTILYLAGTKSLKPALCDQLWHIFSRWGPDEFNETLSQQLNSSLSRSSDGALSRRLPSWLTSSSPPKGSEGSHWWLLRRCKMNVNAFSSQREKIKQTT